MTNTLISEEGNIFLINKELGWTSFDVVKKMRNMLKVKKVGHAGTLDPLATGLLIVCSGKKTKQINQFMDLEKGYSGTFVLGKTTPSYDLETAINNTKSILHLTEDSVLEASKKFTGNIMQVPPMYSALKKDGEPLYKKARRGQKVKLDPRPVEVKDFKIVAISWPEVQFELVCSKGFYVRSLARDFGEELGVGAYLSSLCRTRIGTYKLTDALTVAKIQDQLANEYR